ncbi:hypothetical protein [Lacipirellula sp.]
MRIIAKFVATVVMLRARGGWLRLFAARSTWTRLGCFVVRAGSGRVAIC